MTTLLTFSDNIKAIYCRYDYIFTPIVKFILSLFIFMNINSHTGYMAILNNIFVIVALSLIGAFLPIEFIAGMGFVVLVLQSFKVSMDVCFVGLALIMIFYCGYMRFVPKTGLLVLLVPLCYTLHLTYAIPVVAGFLVGPAAVIPVAFGLILYQYELELNNLINVLDAVTEDDEKIQGYQYIMDALISNKEMMLTMIVFAVVILATYLVYRMSFEYSWIVAFVVGGILNIVLFLVGSVMLLVEVTIVPVLLGSIGGIIIAVLIQFFKGVVDYQRTEVLQFEDDNYYYYVKAVPKLSIAQKKENVKHINSKSEK